jgi:cytochrome P450
MSSYLMHHSPSIFPKSHTFDPDRWLNKDQTANGKPLSRYLVSFSKGTRMCVGLHLAWAELYIGLANVFRRVDLELFETARKEVQMAREFFVPQPEVGSKGVRVVVK